MELNAVDLATFGWKLLDGQIVSAGRARQSPVGAGQARLRGKSTGGCVPLRPRMVARQLSSGRRIVDA